MDLSQNALARAVHVAPRRINEIVLGKRDITADTDLRLARYFGLSEGFFLGLQMDYDLMQRRREIDRDLKTIRRARHRSTALPYGGAIRTHGKTRPDLGKTAFRPAQRRVFRRLCQAGICRARTGHALGEIAGPEIAAHSEPLKIQWPRPVEGQPQEPATLVLRVEGPMALEIEHASDVILQRVNRFFGWSAVGRLALRQAPLSRRERPRPLRAPDAEGGRRSRGNPVLGRGRAIAGGAGAARRLDQAKLSLAEVGN